VSELRYGQATDVGRVRTINEDRFFGDGSVFAVADGMGGHSGGEVASGLAIETLSERSRLAGIDDLVGLVHTANERIVGLAREDPSLRGMGTTISVLATLDTPDIDTRLGVANVGDSRVYRLDDGGIEQITEDHSLVEALVRDGRLSPEEAGRHPQRNILTRALGIDERVLVDAWELEAVTGDRYLVCSDGLFNELTVDEMATIVAELDDPQAAADLLVERACDAGGRDNVTAVVVHVTEGADLEPDAQRMVAVRRAVPDAETFEPADEDDPSARAADGTSASGPADEPSTTTRRRRWRGWRANFAGAFAVLLLVLMMASVATWARSAYFVGVDGADVVIFQGRPGGVLWFDPTIAEPVNISVAELDESDYETVAAGVEFGNIDEARDYGIRLALRVRGD
jgi:serine/threonine protein phosphatase PrpC